MKTTPNEQDAGVMKPGEETFNGNYTAIPKDMGNAAGVNSDDDLIATPMDYGEMNEQDAKAAGYTGDDGEAVDMAKKDVEGSPTGALTDLGAGRSSVVHKKH